MERKTNIAEAQKIMGKNFIGPKELKKIGSLLGVDVSDKFPAVPFKKDLLNKIRKDYILILGLPVTINKIRESFGYNPKKAEPCFYNQDWYLREEFASKCKLQNKWYLIRKKVVPQTRGKNPEKIKKGIFPSVVLATFTFFAYYFNSNGEILWENDFIWCKDKDSNGDRIYVGRYKDPKKINKNGFNIHRHLSIRSCYGVAQEIL